MTEIVRRLFSRLPLLLISTLAFFALFSRLPQKSLSRPFPTFLNSQPVSAQRACSKSFEQLLVGNSAYQPKLSQLGGACLPQILPRLGNLRLEQRRVVALALWPIAKRMGLAERELMVATPELELSDKLEVQKKSGDFAILFWEQFQEDRALDFKVSSVKRLVNRLALGRLSLRRLDLINIDTFALPLLVKALGRVETEEDVARVRRVSSLMSHILEEKFILPESSSILDAKFLASDIRRFWDHEGPAYTPMNRVQLSFARLAQTRFGIWTARSWRSLSAKDAGRTRKKVWRFTLLSLPLLLIAAGASLLAAPVIVGASQLIILGRKRWQRGWIIRIIWAFLSALSLVLLLHSSDTILLREELVISFIALAWTAFILQREVADRIDWRVHQVLRTRSTFRRVKTVARWLGPTLPTFIPLFASQWVVWVICAEFSGNRDGWGYRTLIALREGDLPWLMASSMSLTIGALLVQIITDLVLGRTVRKKGPA